MSARIPFASTSTAHQTPKPDSDVMKTPRKPSAGLINGNGPMQTTPSLGSRTTNNIGKPLNVANLVPKKHHNHNNIPHMLRTNSIDSAENIINNNPKLVNRNKMAALIPKHRPSPNRSQSPGFKLPGLPRPPQFPPADDSSHDITTPNDLGAHIPTLNPPRKLISAPPTRFPLKRLRHEQSLERISEADEGDAGQVLDIHGGGGSRHNSEEVSHDSMNRMNGLDSVGAYDDDERYQSRSKSRSALVAEAQGMAMTGKQEEYEQDEVEAEYALNSKRIKLSVSRRVDEYEDGYDAPQDHGHSQFQLGLSQAPMSSQEEVSAALETPLIKIFGNGANEYAMQNLATFADDKARWANCSVEEWKEGRKELSQGFQQMMDLVLDRYTNMTERFTKIDGTFDDHEKTLHDKEEALNKKRDEMIKGSKDFFA